MRESVERLAEGLVMIRSMLWSQTSGIRKAARCKKCSRQMKIGEKAYRPLTNGIDRQDRICPKCIEG